MNEQQANAHLQAIFDDIKNNDDYFRITQLKWMIDQIKWYITQIQDGKA